ncbi:hypothetical protein TWF679_010935 [Orbilia oligospora]|uniref:Phosphatidylserine decarboxylase n=1 Tax=Orbilia oligospora TaxID=2813651 RepID=A0A8H8VII1_ORBOL|nr:hypothetical protein TWF679_010935 [Orbilia oligospora]
MGLFAFILGYVSTILDEFMGYCKLIQNREVGWPTVDRKTGELKREQQPIWKKIKLILLFNPIAEWSQHFSIANLLGDPSIAESFADGPVASFRLSPQDYHRYHAPVTGTVKWYKQFSGEYYNVDPWNLRSHIDVLTSNARCAVCFETEKYGDVIFVAIGASDVGTVKFNEDTRIPGRRIRKGQEIGRFEFGGSSILVVFQKGRILFDEDLLNLSNERIMVDVEVGMSLGRLQAKGGEKRGSVDEESGKVNEKRQKVNEMHEKAGETETYAQAVSEGGKKSDSEKEDTQTTKKAAKALRIT